MVSMFLAPAVGAPFPFSGAIDRRGILLVLITMSDGYFDVFHTSPCYWIEEAVRIGQRMILPPAHPGRVRDEFQPSTAEAAGVTERRIQSLLMGEGAGI